MVEEKKKIENKRGPGGNQWEHSAQPEANYRSKEKFRSGWYRIRTTVFSLCLVLFDRVRVLYSWPNVTIVPESFDQPGVFHG